MYKKNNMTILEGKIMALDLQKTLFRKTAIERFSLIKMAVSWNTLKLVQ